MNILELLYVGNKKAKELRDQNQRIWEFHNEGGAVCSDDFWLSEQQTNIFDFCHNFTYRGIKEYLKDLSDDDYEYLEIDDRLDFMTVESRLSDTVRKNKNLMEQFYTLKSHFCLAMMTPMGVHKSKHFREYYSYTEDCVYTFHDFYVLFEKDGYQFHTPADDVDEKIPNYDDLPRWGELPQISSEIERETPYNDWDLQKIITTLNTLKSE